MKFLRLNVVYVDFKSVSFDLLDSRSPLYERIKFGYPFKTRDFCYCRLI